MKQNLVKKKVCPRCKGKTFLEATQCPHCSLLFERIQNLSNKEAKEQIKAKNSKNVLYVTTMPSDISKKKFYLYFILLGWFGAHNLYVGKLKRGYYALVTSLLALVSFIVQEVVFLNVGVGASNLVNYYFTGPCFTFFVFAILIWFYDLFNLTLKKYTYPATLPKKEANNIYFKKIVSMNDRKDKAIIKKMSKSNDSNETLSKQEDIYEVDEFNKQEKENFSIDKDIDIVVDKENAKQKDIENSLPSTNEDSEEIANSDIENSLIENSEVDKQKQNTDKNQKQTQNQICDKKIEQNKTKKQVNKRK